jgi:hypothetical protein
MSIQQYFISKASYINHLTSCRISPDGNAWYHDGIATGRGCENDGSIKTMSDHDLQICRNHTAVLAVYAQR